VRFPHSAGATVKRITVSVKGAGDYSLDPATGTITELIEFGAGKAVIVSYTTDWVVPASYPVTFNDSPDLDANAGEWSGEALVDGTYTVGLWGSVQLSLALYGETNSYRSTATAATADFLVGSASTPEPYALISSGQNCLSCHQDVLFHGGGRRGFEACLLCHGTSGAEDRPQYVAANAPATTGATVSFRTMIHKIHMGEELANASAYELVGFGSAAWPNNFGVVDFAEIAFPAMPDGTKNCAACHGPDNTAWFAPAERLHPDVSVPPTQSWRAVCGSCHDSASTTAHIDAQTAPTGFESCEVCHGDGGPWRVDVVHKTR
jgi:OmcA/MtrC family decaheme c-type cytochrome